MSNMQLEVVPFRLWGDRALASSGSRNFFINLISVVFLSMEYNKLGPLGDPEQIVDAIIGGELNLILGVLITNLLNPILKLINKTASWSWGFLKSQNFWVQVATVGLTLLASLGVAFPEGAAAAIVEAIFGGELNAILTALFTNVLNPLLIFLFGRSGQKKPTKDAPTVPIRK